MRAHFGLAAVVVCLAGACSGNSLTGSVEQRFSLAFNELRIVSDPPYLIIEYDGSAGVIPCKLILNTTGLAMANDTTLSEAPFLEHVTFTRIASDGLNYATLLSGQLKFGAYTARVGGHVAGNFNALFSDGFLLQGDFSGALSTLPR